MNSTWIDISIPVTEAILSWPSDPVYKQKKFASFDSGKPCDASEVSMSVHTGTHIDAPSHFIQNGKTMDSWTPESTIGKCRVIEIEDSKEVTDSELLKHAIQKGERILFRTKNSSSKWWEKSFNENFICISPGAAAYLAKIKPLCIGVDYLSIGSPLTGVEAHQHLLGAEIWLIESLNLCSITAGNYELIFMPVNLASAEGAPGRALIKKVD